MEFFSDVGGDALKPTLFELIAQEQLRDLLQPALKYVLAVSHYASSMKPMSLMSNGHTGVCSAISALSTAIGEPTRGVLRCSHVLRGTALFEGS